MRMFFIHVRYWGGFIIVMIGGLLAMPGELVMRFGRWIASRDRSKDHGN
jgi:lauroyl/myristoyl acyltransferase